MASWAGGVILLASLVIAGCADDTTSDTTSSTGGGAIGGGGASIGGSEPQGGGATGGGGSANDGGGGGGGAAPVAPTFGEPATLSDGAGNAFVPSIAANGTAVLVAWHEFPPNEGARVAFALVDDGQVGAPIVLAEEVFAGAKQPSVAATSDGFVLAYEAFDGTTNVIRAVELDSSGAVVQGPDTISIGAPGAAMARVAAFEDQRVFAWTDGSAHWFATRGPDETVSATAVGTTLVSQGILNFPRVALDADGTVFLAYRDGGPDTIDWEVLLVVRPSGGSFSEPVNVSNSPALLSDDIALALEADGTLDLAWVDQDARNVNAFEVEYATRAPSGELSTKARYGDQGLWAWKPSILAGLDAVWYTGSFSGPMSFGAVDVPPTPILPAETVKHVGLAMDSGGRYHLTWATKVGDVDVIRYASAEAQ